MDNDHGASALPTGLSSLRDEADKSSSPKASIPSREMEDALRFLAEIVVPVLEDVLDDDGALDEADAACDADGICDSHWCRSGGCVVDKLRFARRIVEITRGDTACPPVQGHVRWHSMLPASVDRNPEGQDRNGLGAEHGSAIGESRDAQTTSPSPPPVSRD